MRVTLFAERLARPFDEGIKNWTLSLAAALRAQHEVQVLTAYGQDLPELGVLNVPANRLLLSGELQRRIRRFRPERVLYVPTAAATPFSFWRARALRFMAGGAPVTLVALQVRHHGALARRVMGCLAPEVLAVQSARTRQSLEVLGSRVARRLVDLPPAIDLARFSPADAAQRRALRQRWDIPPDAWVLLHVGHLNPGRGIQMLPLLASQAGDYPLVVGSSSTPHDAALVAELRRQGVRVIDEPVAAIEELYQLADCYVFPVAGETSAIDLPLSALEAMACDLPVVSTPFGALPGLFGGRPGVLLAESLELGAACQAARAGGHRASTRSLVQGWSWEHLVQALLAAGP